MENAALLIGLASIFVLGVGAQWLAWRLRVPSIVLLLGFGFLVGPVTGRLDPDALLGDLLFPVVSLSVAVVLFEGSLRLQLRELSEIGRVLVSLLTVGVVVTWGLTTLAGVVLLGLNVSTALLLGAVLVVTGPTVVGPLLRHIRPEGQVGPIARWEGIVIDPIGAVLAVLVFEASASFQVTNLREGLLHVAHDLVLLHVVSVTLGLVGAELLVQLLRRHWIPDHLISPVALMLVVLTFTASNLLKHESGLLAVTLMGVWVANRGGFDLKPILEFKENLSVLLISSLFILLSARVQIGEVAALGWWGAAFVVWMILVVRPVAVLLSTLGSRLTWAERAFLAWLAPRGIVAASVASVFAIQMGEAGNGLVPATFLVIVGTVVVYGATAFPLARRLGLSNPNPQGVLIASAHAGARAIAGTLGKLGFRALLADTNRWNVSAARMEGLDTDLVNVLSEHAEEELDLGGIGRLLALTPNDEVNALAALHYAELFGRRQVYQLVPHGTGTDRRRPSAQVFRGRFLFGEGATYEDLDRRFESGAVVKATKLTEEFDYEAFRARHGDEALILFVVDGKRLIVCTADEKPTPKPGHTIVALVKPPSDVPAEPVPS